MSLRRCPFAGWGAGATCLIRLKERMEGVQQDEIQEILVLEPRRSGDCFANLMGSIDSSALHVLPSVR